MGLETFTFVSSLDPNNPTGADLYSTADDHLRGIKTTLRNTFVNATGAINANPTEFNRLVGLTSAIETQGNKNAVNGYAGLNASSQLANAQVSAANITQHQAALTIAETQITDGSLLARVASAETISALWNYTTIPTVESVSVRNASILNAGTLADARVAASNVTQHQAALSIGASQLTGTLADARVAQSNVTQHQAALTIAETQITDGSLLARVAATETISGQWTYSTRPRHNAAGGYLSHANSSNTSGVVEFSTTVPGAVFGNPGDIRLVY